MVIASKLAIENFRNFATKTNFPTLQLQLSLLQQKQDNDGFREHHLRPSCNRAEYVMEYVFIARIRMSRKVLYLTTTLKKTIILPLRAYYYISVLFYANFQQDSRMTTLSSAISSLRLIYFICNNSRSLLED